MRKTEPSNWSRASTSSSSLEMTMWSPSLSVRKWQQNYILTNAFFFSFLSKNDSCYNLRTPCSQIFVHRCATQVHEERSIAIRAHLSMPRWCCPHAAKGTLARSSAQGRRSWSWRLGRRWNDGSPLDLLPSYFGTGTPWWSATSLIPVFKFAIQIIIMVFASQCW